MTKYRKDRCFTDFVHENLAINLIYKKIGWELYQLEDSVQNFIDLNFGIDYVFKSDDGDIKYIQERFRDKNYSKYSDATLRYRRDRSKYGDRIESEFYKIKSDFLVYGVVNGLKNIEKRNSLTDFIKWVILDLSFLRQKFREGKIKIKKSENIRCKSDGKSLFCPINFNPDGSSSFIPLDIILLNDLWGKSVIFSQKGYF